jgi:hypothetical protein
LRGIESRNSRDTATAFAKAFPRLFRSRAERGYQSHAGDNDSSFLQLEPL